MKSVIGYFYKHIKDPESVEINEKENLTTSNNKIKKIEWENNKKG
jgi:hypothetical protein